MPVDDPSRPGTLSHSRRRCFCPEIPHGPGRPALPANARRLFTFAVVLFSNRRLVPQRQRSDIASVCQQLTASRTGELPL